MSINQDVLNDQKRICKNNNIVYSQIDLEKKIGISQNFFNESILPIHGLRHYETNSSLGWFLWRGEYSEDDDFFESYHAAHIIEQLDDAASYLALPPGWRFLINPQEHYEDVWFDKNLLIVD